MKKSKFIPYIFHKDHFLIVGLTCLILFILSLITFTVPVFYPISKALKNLSATDLFFQIENASSVKDTCDIITIVDMTELHSRGDIAQLLSLIESMNPIVIGIDLIFEGIKDDERGNYKLEESVINIYEHSVFANKLIAYNEAKGYFEQEIHSYFADFIPINEAYTNVADNMEKATLRNLTIERKTQDGMKLSFAAQIAQFMGHPLDMKDDMLIDYKPTYFRTIAYNNLENNKDFIKDKIVLVGAAKEEQDMHLSSLGKMPGVEIQAYSLLTLLEHKDIKQLSVTHSILLGLILCFLFELMFDMVSRWISRRKATVRILISESRLHLSIVSIVYLSIVSLLMFYIFKCYNLYIDAVVIFSMLTFIGFSRRIYSGIIKSLKINHSNHFINNSLF